MLLPHADCPGPSADGLVASIPLSTSSVMAARQFCKLQAGPHHPSTNKQGIPPAVMQKTISTRIRADAWARALCNHPDQPFVTVLLIRLALHKARPAAAPLKTSLQHWKTVIWLMPLLSSSWQQATWPFLFPNCSGVIASNLSVVPKKTPGKWRVIVNLSRPRRASMNDFIKREFTHVAYSSLDDAAPIMHTLGRNTELAKTDIRDAYCIIFIHPRIVLSLV